MKAKLFNLRSKPAEIIIPGNIELGDGWREIARAYEGGYVHLATNQSGDVLMYREAREETTLCPTAQDVTRFLNRYVFNRNSK